MRFIGLDGYEEAKMKVHKIVTRVCIFRRGVEAFTREVNTFLAKGWKVSDVTIEKSGLRIICCALIVLEQERPTPQKTTSTKPLDSNLT